MEPDTEADAEPIPDTNSAPVTTSVESTPTAAEANLGGGAVGLFIPVLLAVFRRRFQIPEKLGRATAKQNAIEQTLLYQPDVIPGGRSG